MSVVSTAMELVGKVKYVFGANDIPGGRGDCSAFTQHVFRENGVEIGRDTRSQFSKGQSVGKEELKPGDLVFFQGTYRDGVSHVGIYTGGGQFVHCSGDGTQVSSLSESYWTEHWLGAKRISGVDGGSAVTSPDTGKTTIAGATTSKIGESIGLEWWGDILVVVLVLLACVLAVVFLVKSFNFDFSPVDKIKEVVTNG